MEKFCVYSSGHRNHETQTYEILFTSAMNCRHAPHGTIKLFARLLKNKTRVYIRGGKGANYLSKCCKEKNTCTFNDLGLLSRSYKKWPISDFFDTVTS